MYKQFITLWNFSIVIVPKVITMFEAHNILHIYIYTYIRNSCVKTTGATTDAAALKAVQQGNKWSGAEPIPTC